MLVLLIVLPEAELIDVFRYRNLGVALIEMPGEKQAGRAAKQAQKQKKTEDRIKLRTDLNTNVNRNLPRNVTF